MPAPPELAEAARAIAEGLVVAFPTDTLYGLAVDPRSSGALARLFALKGRGAERAVALVAADLAQVRQVAEIDEVAVCLADAFWPGPLTLVLPARRALSPSVLNDRGAVGVRVPDHAVARSLARLCGHPVTATSANLTGEPASADPEEVARRLPGLDVLVDAGRAPGGPPSTVVELRDGRPILVRAGAVAWERVLESLASASDRSFPPPAPDGTRFQSDS